MKKLSEKVRKECEHLWTPEEGLKQIVNIQSSALLGSSFGQIDNGHNDPTVNKIEIAGYYCTKSAMTGA